MRERRLTASLDFVGGLEGDFLTLSNDNVISRDIRLHGAWGLGEVEVFKRFLRPGDVAVDVGANLGHHTVSMSKIVGAAGKIYAFEPQRRIYRLLCANLALNRCDHAEIFECALGDRTRTVMMEPLSYDDPETPWNVGSLVCQSYETVPLRGKLVDVRRMDDVLPVDVRVDFIKSDAQGFDYHVLRGAVGTLERWHPTVLVEVSPVGASGAGVNYLAIDDMLRQLGYELRAPATLNVYTTPREWTGAHGEEWDLLAIHTSNAKQMERLGQSMQSADS
jgi:FkbM family methyltransferase